MLTALVGKYLTPLKIAGVILLLSSLAITTLYAKSLREDNIELSNTIALNKVTISSLHTEVDLLSLQRENDQRASQLIAQSYTDLRENYQRLSDELSNYKGRSTTVIKKPSLVERRINLATDRLFRDFYCDTGGSCSDDSTVPSTTP